MVSPAAGLTDTVGARAGQTCLQTCEGGRAEEASDEDGEELRHSRRELCAEWHVGWEGPV